jgi:hypothetical protein
VTGLPRWAMSPLDYRVHQVAEGGHSPDVLAARCGLQLPISVTPQDQPPPGPRCQRCDVLVRADAPPATVGSTRCSHDADR